MDESRSSSSCNNNSFYIPLDRASGDFPVEEMQGCLGEFEEGGAGDGIRALYHRKRMQQMTARTVIVSWMQGICLVEYRELQCIAEVSGHEALTAGMVRLFNVRMNSTQVADNERSQKLLPHARN